MELKRYQFFGKQGIQWTDWFPTNGKSQEPIQLKCYKGRNLKNEYKEVGS
jgi:hypothetical protein